MPRGGSKGSRIESDIGSPAPARGIVGTAVAVDPPPRGTLGIRELLTRLESYAETDYFSPAQSSRRRPRTGTIGRWALGTLAEPDHNTEPLDVEGWSAEDLRTLIGKMIMVRKVEQSLARLVTEGHVRCPVHLAVGQEAVPVGVAYSLNAGDRVFGGHRSHGHYLAMGGDVYRLIAETLGKADGCSRGMGGSMHLFAPEVGFWGSVPIVGATIPVAVGAALAAAMDNAGAVAVSYFGDGAVEEGVVHESLNLASQMRLPVLFVCENNLYSSHLDIAQRQPSDCTARIADAHGVACAVVDGNDVLAVAKAARELIEAARRGEGPGYLEAVTYRWYGHVGPDENIDVGLRRSASELAAWKLHDPIARLAAGAMACGDVTAGEIPAMEEQAARSIEAAIAKALSAPYPETGALFDYVYVNNAR